jgi:hypothetical protein
VSTEDSNIISRFQRLEPLAAPPGPLAQAITFRAVGAETLGFTRPLPLAGSVLTCLHWEWHQLKMNLRQSSVLDSLPGSDQAG